MTNRLITPLIPTTDDRAYAMMLDCLDAALADARAQLPRWDPLHEIRDADDYIAASAHIAYAITSALTSDMPSALDALDLLLFSDDDDFAFDCLTADFSADLLHLFDFAD